MKVRSFVTILKFLEFVILKTDITASSSFPDNLRHQFPSTYFHTKHAVAIWKRPIETTPFDTLTTTTAKTLSPKIDSSCFQNDSESIRKGT